MVRGSPKGGSAHDRAVFKKAVERRAKEMLEEEEREPSGDAPAVRESPDRAETSQPPFYESTLLWGALGAVISLVSVYLGFALRDIRWFLGLAWPFCVVFFVRLAKTIPRRRLRYLAILGSALFSALGLAALAFIFPPPKSEESVKQQLEEFFNTHKPVAQPTANLDDLARRVAKQLSKSDLSIQNLALMGIVEIQPNPEVQVTVKNSGNEAARIVHIDSEVMFVTEWPQDFVGEHRGIFQKRYPEKQEMNSLVGATDEKAFSLPVENVKFKTPNDALYPPISSYYAMGRIWWKSEGEGLNHTDFCGYIPSLMERKLKPEYSTGLDIFGFANIWMDCMPFTKPRPQ